MTETTYKLKQVEALSGVRQNKIRYYREQGVVNPIPMTHGKRVFFEYSMDDITKLKWIEQLIGWFGLTTSLWIWDNHKADLIKHGIIGICQIVLEKKEQERKQAAADLLVVS